MCFRKLLQQFTLACCQPRRHLNEDSHKEISSHLFKTSRVESGLKRRKPLAPEPKHFARLRALGQAQLDTAFQGRSLDGGAQRQELKPPEPRAEGTSSDISGLRERGRGRAGEERRARLDRGAAQLRGLLLREERQQLVQHRAHL